MTDLRHADAYDEGLEDDAPPVPARRLRYNPQAVRSEDAFGAAERHSSRVRKLRIILPAIAIVAVVAFWASARFIPGDLADLVQSAGIDVATNSVVMQQPHISGFEGTRRAYELKADTAVQSLSDPKVVTFNSIDGRFGLEDAGVATLDAGVGVYNGNTNTLTLKDGIGIQTNTGYSATLQGAAIDLAKGSLVSDQPLELRTAEGSIRANGVSVEERGKRVKFTNGVTVVFMPPAELMSGGGTTAPAAETAE